MCIYIYIHIDTTLVELHPDPCFSQIRDVEDFEDPPEITEAFFFEIICEDETVVTENKCSGATFLDVPALDQAQRKYKYFWDFLFRK